MGANLSEKQNKTKSKRKEKNTKQRERGGRLGWAGEGSIFSLSFDVGFDFFLLLLLLGSVNIINYNHSYFIIRVLEARASAD